jgi:hypothetical protein
MREYLACCLDVTVDEVVVGLAADPAVAVANVRRVVEQALLVGADVKDDRQDPVGVDSGRRRVDGELADRDVDSVRTPVSDTENLLATIRSMSSAWAPKPRSAPSTESGLSMDRNSPRGRVYTSLNFSMASPTVGS